jgi:hypothetical protein
MSATRRCELRPKVYTSPRASRRGPVTRGRITGLIYQSGVLIKYLVDLETALPDESEYLKSVAKVLLGSHTKLLLASGHAQTALLYCLWRAKILADDSGLAISREPLKNNYNAGRAELLTDIQSTADKLLRINDKTDSDEVSERINVAMQLARLILETVVLLACPHFWYQGL